MDGRPIFSWLASVGSRDTGGRRSLGDLSGVNWTHTRSVSRAPLPATQSRGTLDRLESDRPVAPLANGRGGESCLEGLAGGRQLNHWAWIWVGLGRARFSWVEGTGGG